ncbi:MAG: S1 RNA-binding domain-containing protein, partial [Myxococcota bacterium]
MELALDRLRPALLQDGGNLELIDVSEDGTVRIASVDGSSGKEALRRIELITADVEVGRVYEGKVARLMDFGAFVTILPGKDGLVH